MIALVKTETHANPDEQPPAGIPRFLWLARKIHAAFTQREEKERAALRAAETLVQKKNAAIQAPVQEVVRFCQLLTQAPGLTEQFASMAQEMAERLLGNRYAYSLDNEVIVLRYSAPAYHVDMNAPDHTKLTGTDNAHMYIGFSPVRISPAPDHPLDVPTTTTHAFFSRNYRILPDGTIMEEVKGKQTNADPIVDIITELRSILGGEYFESKLLPFWEESAGVENS